MGKIKNVASVTGGGESEKAVEDALITVEDDPADDDNGTNDGGNDGANDGDNDGTNDGDDDGDDDKGTNGGDSVDESGVLPNTGGPALWLTLWPPGWVGRERDLAALGVSHRG